MLIWHSLVSSFSSLLIIRGEREWYSGHDGVGSGSMYTHMHTLLVEEELWCGRERVEFISEGKVCSFFILLLCFLLFFLTFGYACRGTEG